MKIGRWLEQHFVLAATTREEGEKQRHYLDENGFDGEFFDACLFDSQEDANAAKAKAKHEYDWNAVPLSLILRLPKEEQ